MKNDTYSRDGLTVTEIEAFTSLTSPKLSEISFKVVVNGKERIDKIVVDGGFHSRMLDFLSSNGNSHNRAETYYDMIK